MNLNISALISVAIHALILMCMTGFVLFPPTISKTLAPVDLIVVNIPSEQQETSGSDKKIEESQALKTQGNAQWTIRPGVRDESRSLRRRTISAASHEARDADYLARWRDRVEDYGTRYYQQKIKSQPLSGEVRILVSIGPKGELIGAHIRQSSGQPALDKMAIEILKKLAPFEPLPSDIRRDTDVLEIIRTWKFTAKEGLRGG